MTDHNIILFDLIGLNDNHTPCMNPKNTNWESYSICLRIDLEQARSRALIETSYGTVRSYESSCFKLFDYIYN